MRRVIAFETPEELAEATASDIASLAARAAGGGRRFGLALSGGSTPRLTLEALARPDRGVDWAMVDLFWVDERCVPPEHPDSNYGMARDALLVPASVPASCVRRIRGEADPATEADRYAAEFEAALPASTRPDRTPVLDLVLLGMGDDGHAASIFPYNAELFHSGRLYEVSAHPTSGQRRITMTGRPIVAAKEVAFLVAGPSKAARVAEILERRGGFATYPAWMADDARGGAVWRLDREAARLLAKETLNR